MSGKQFNLGGKFRMNFKRVFFTFLFTLSGFAQPEIVKFVKTPFAQIHQNPTRISRILTTFECGQGLKIKKSDGDFVYVSFANYEGYILESHLQESKPNDCYQDKYRKFFEYLNLGISEMHYFGKLQDMMIEGQVLP